MRWEGRRQSEHVEDRRGVAGRPLAFSGAGLLVALLLSVVLGQNPLQLLNLISDLQEVSAPPAVDSPSTTHSPTDRLGHFASVVLADTEDTWKAVFATLGRVYEEPRLVLFTDGVPCACGLSSAAVGLFYYSRDQRVYLDLSFFTELADRFGAQAISPQRT